MNLFCQLTDITDLDVSVVWHSDQGNGGSVSINGVGTDRLHVPLLSSIEIIMTNAWINTITVDGIEIHDYLPVQTDPCHTVSIPEPFYRWWHIRSGQGWLLYPWLPG